MHTLILILYIGINFYLEPDEIFANILFQSKVNSITADADVELPKPTDKGQYNFSELDVSYRIKGFITIYINYIHCSLRKATSSFGNCPGYRWPWYKQSMHNQSLLQLLKLSKYN